jgi:omega-6 fatty acid desaturase (delta-12 desaturase)
MNESELFKKYKSSYKSAFLDLSMHTFYLSSAFYLLWFFRNSWFSLFTIPIMALLNIKTFIIFHDCGHHSYSPSRALNYIIGIITGVVTVTPFNWTYNHNIHHLTNGNYENIYDHSYNETIFTSLRQYKNFSRKIQQLYKFIKHPFVFFSIIPALKFLIVMRFNALRFFKNKKIPASLINMKKIMFIEQIINNIGIGFLIYKLYNYSIIYHYLISTMIASSIGIMLFHSQHGFNNETYSQRDSGLLGSSFIKIPYILKYFSGGIEYHHIHHMNSKIPNYNLQYYHEEVVSKSDMFNNIVKLSITECYNNLWLVLYDEDKKKYITFKDADIDDNLQKKIN